jgi:uroporphyrinogen-III synthase
MAAATRPRLEVVGGGFDYLAHLSRAGTDALLRSPLIIHPPGVPAALVKAVAPQARLESAAPREGLRRAADLLRRGESHLALLVPDLSASAGFRRKLLLLERDGFGVGLHPSVTLSEAALLAAGVPPGEWEAVVLEEESLAAAAQGVLPDVLWKPSLAVGFDGAIFWPGRRVEPERIARQAAALPGDGSLYLFPIGTEPVPPRTGLGGRGVLVTRALEQADDLGLLLRSRGAVPVYLPALALAPPPDPGLLDRALDDLDVYQGLILTSANAVERFFDLFFRRGGDLRRLAGIPILAVGSKTGQALSRVGLTPDRIPDDFRAEGLLEILRAEGVRGKRFLLPRAEEAREILPEGIREAGGEVDVAVLYRTVRGEFDRSSLERLLRAGVLDAITFTSGSAFRYFMDLAGEGPGQDALSTLAVACIGPVAAREVRAGGHRVDVIPPRATVEDLVESLDTHFSALQSNR